MEYSKLVKKAESDLKKAVESVGLDPKSYAFTIKQASQSMARRTVFNDALAEHLNMHQTPMILVQNKDGFEEQRKNPLVDKLHKEEGILQKYLGMLGLSVTGLTDKKLEAKNNKANKGKGLGLGK